MLARLIASLVLGLIMYVPRPTPPRTDGPGDGPPAPSDPPPTPGDLPPGPDGPRERPDIGFEPPIRHLPPHDHYPSVPPTPPPGYDGDWPPASERPDVPPTPPPGYDGDWPGTDRPNLRDRIQELLRQLNDWLRPEDTAIAKDGVHLLRSPEVDET